MLKAYLSRYLYIQLAPERLTVRDPKTQVTVSEVPEVAIARPPGQKATVLAIGTEAKSLASTAHTAVINPFAHPRSLISDFTAAELVLKAFVKRIAGKSFWQPAPVLVMHPLVNYEGGLTQVEIRCLRELAMAAGASRVCVWQGPHLSDEQLLVEQFPPNGQRFDE
jgi:rod shape-determining protein MreB and related proteins